MARRILRHSVLYRQDQEKSKDFFCGSDKTKARPYHSRSYKKGTEKTIYDAVHSSPGPANHGIIGNFPLGSTDPLGLYTQWAHQYGDIFYYRVFSRHIYFLNNPDLIEHVLVNDYKSFIKGDALQFNRRIFGNGLLTNDGESWLQQRHLIQPAFYRDRIESYGDAMVAYTERMLAGWHDGEVRDIHLDMMRLALEIVSKSLFSVELTADTDRIARALNTFMELGARVCYYLQFFACCQQATTSVTGVPPANWMTS
ncbi:MAG: cytochrome P450 [Candidatus Sulfotelmatobacter sp.]